MEFRLAVELMFTTFSMNEFGLLAFVGLLFLFYPKIKVCTDMSEIRFASLCHGRLAFHPLNLTSRVPPLHVPSPLHLAVEHAGVCIKLQ